MLGIAELVAEVKSGGLDEPKRRHRHHAIVIHTLIRRFDPDSFNVIVDRIEAGYLSSKEDPLAVRRRPRPGLKSHALAGLEYLLTDFATRAAVNHE
jgi:hypothetical protein